MFDDHIPQNQGGQVPPNLPVGEPEDMFAGVEQDVPQKQPTPMPGQLGPNANVPGHEIIDQPSALEAGILKPKQSTPPMPAPQPNIPAREASAPRYTTPPEQAAPEYQEQIGGYDIKHPTTSRNILIGIVVVLVFVIVGGGAWFIYSQYMKAPTDPNTVPPIVTPPEDTTPLVTPTTTEDEVPKDNESPEQPIDPALRDEEILFGTPVDTDEDGLEDIQEQQLGTDPANWDTDGDELGDAEEVNVWKTDPLNPDTDGDSYLDGSEVRNGYNPAGPGKIFEIPTATSSPATSTEPTNSSVTPSSEPAPTTGS